MSNFANGVWGGNVNRGLAISLFTLSVPSTLIHVVRAYINASKRVRDASGAIQSEQSWMIAFVTYTTAVSAIVLFANIEPNPLTSEDCCLSHGLSRIAYWVVNFLWFGAYGQQVKAADVCLRQVLSIRALRYTTGALMIILMLTGFYPIGDVLGCQIREVEEQNTCFFRPSFAIASRTLSLFAVLVVFLLGSMHLAAFAYFWRKSLPSAESLNLRRLVLFGLSLSATLFTLSVYVSMFLEDKEQNVENWLSLALLSFNVNVLSLHFSWEQYYLFYCKRVFLKPKNQSTHIYSVGMSRGSDLVLGRKSSIASTTSDGSGNGKGIGKRRRSILEMQREAQRILNLQRNSILSNVSDTSKSASQMTNDGKFSIITPDDKLRKRRSDVKMNILPLQSVSSLANKHQTKAITKPQTSQETLRTTAETRTSNSHTVDVKISKNKVQQPTSVHSDKSASVTHISQVSRRGSIDTNLPSRRTSALVSRGGQWARKSSEVSQMDRTSSRRLAVGYGLRGAGGGGRESQVASRSQLSHESKFSIE